MDVASVALFFISLISAVVLASQERNVDAPGRLVSTVLALAAAALSIVQIVSHLSHYHQPVRQRYVIRILLMVPIYALDSLWGFFDRGHTSAIDLARDTYEAYVIYNFFWLLLDLNGGVEGTVAYWRARKPTMPHMFPLRGVMRLDAWAITQWRWFTFQYMVVSVGCTVATIAFGGVSNESIDGGSWSVENWHLWMSAARSLSVTVSFTALLYFYLATKYNIHDENPTGKFMSIKGVIFMCCWQGVVISGLSYAGIFPENAVRWLLFKPADIATHDTVVAALENLLVIVEIAIAAVAHHFVFSYKAFPPVPGETQSAYYSPARGGGRRVQVAVQHSFRDAAIHAFSLTDIIDEATYVARPPRPEPEDRHPPAPPANRPGLRNRTDLPPKPWQSRR